MKFSVQQPVISLHEMKGQTFQHSQQSHETAEGKKYVGHSRAKNMFGHSIFMV